MHSISFADKTLKIQFVDNTWLDDLLVANPNAIEHMNTGDGRILTAKTNDIQQFLKKHGPKGELFTDAITLKKGLN